MNKVQIAHVINRLYRDKKCAGPHIVCFELHVVSIKVKIRLYFGTTHKFMDLEHSLQMAIVDYVRSTRSVFTNIFVCELINCATLCECCYSCIHLVTCKSNFD